MYTICYTDDDEVSLSAVKAHLEATGDFTVRAASSAAAGLEVLAAGNCDAVVSGHRPPGMDGLAFLDEVRKRHGHLSFLLFSDDRGEEVVIGALNRGVDFYIQRDKDGDALYADLAGKIRLAVARRQADDERLRTAQEIVNAGICEYDHSTGTVWISEKSSRIFGLKRPHDGSLPISEIRACIPEWDIVQDALSGLIEHGTDCNTEFTVNPADGSSPKIVSAVCRMIPDEDGRPGKVMGIVWDITKSRSEEAAFQRMVGSIVSSIGIESLDRITESVASWLEADCVMIGEITPDGEHVRVLSMILDGEHVNDFSYGLKGSPCENVTEKGYCVYPENAVKLFPDAKDMVELNIQGYVGTAMRNARGDVMGILCVLTKNPLEAPPNLQEIIDLIAVKASTEIERKRSEEMAKRTRELYAHAMDLAHLANWEYDAVEDIFTFDDRFYALYGTTEEREGGTRISSEKYAREFVHPDDRDMVAEEVRKAIEADDPGFVSEVEHRIVRRDGEIRYIVVRFGIVKDENGNTIRTRGANQDITELKLAEQALLQANHKINLLSSITRHDILNQIEVIAGYLEYIRDKPFDAEMTRIIKILTNATGKIQSQIEFTAVYQDLGTQEPQWQSLEEILRRLSVPDEIALSTDLNGIELYADPILEKVFYNLMDNSLKHGQHVSAVNVSASKAGESAIILWEDNGVGIPAEEKTKIFLKGSGKNRGLGLFLSREILAITGMTIKETGEPGKGVSFGITVPKGAYRFG